MKIFERFFHNSISKKTTNDELGITATLNTQSLSGDIKGLPVDTLSYDNFLDSKLEDYYDLWNIYNTYQKVFQTMFKWKGSLSRKQFRFMEERLFRNGKVAIIKLTKEDYLVSDFTLAQEYETDNYGYPKEITINCKGNIMDGKKIKKNFAIVYNNSNMLPTLILLWKRIFTLIKAIDKGDKAIETSDVKIPYSDATDSTKSDELNKKWYSDDIFIQVSNEWLRGENIQPLILQDSLKNKEENILFNLDLINMFLGFKAQNLNLKMERQSEMEVANNDKFEGLILENMYEMRLEGIEEVEEKIGLKLSLEEPDILQDREVDNNIGEGEKNEQ